MAIDISALSAFRRASGWHNDAVANLSGGAIASSGLYEGRIKAAFSSRSQAVKDANNAVRTALLNALGDAYGLARGEGGRFTEAFLDHLQQVLGKEFKRSDFGVDRNGVVKSGKPLTARRINSILAIVDAAKAKTVVDEAIGYLQSNAKIGSRVATTFPFTKSEKKMAIQVVAEYGKSLTDATRGILAKFVVNGISRMKYDGYRAAAIRENVEAIASDAVQVLKGVKTCEHKPTELFQARLNEKMADDKNYVRYSVFNGFMMDGDNTTYKIQGEGFEKRSRAVAQLRTCLRNSNHRRAISTVMSPSVRSLSTNDIVKERDAEVKLAVEGKKATVTVKSQLEFRFNGEDANEWADIPMGTVTHETKFEFDLSDENEAVLTNVDFKQTI